MAYEPTLNTFPSATSSVIVGSRDHFGKVPAAVRRGAVVSLYADDITHFDWDAGEGKDSHAVLARATSEDYVLVFRSDDKSVRDAWLRTNAQQWLGYL